MKKLISMLSVLVLAISTLTFTSCNPEDGIAPVDQWTKATISYEKNSTSVDINCYFFYSEKDEYTGPTVKNDIKTEYKPGLTIVVAPDTNLGDSFTSSKYVVINMPKEEAVNLNEDGSTTDSKLSSVKMNYTLWSAVCLLKTELIKNQSSTAFETLNSNSREKIDLESIKEDFSWKTLLKDILYNVL